MTERPPWAEAVADIIDPDGWYMMDGEHVASARMAGSFVEVDSGNARHYISAQVRENDIESDGMTVVTSDADIPTAIRRCYAAALVASGNTEAALAVLKGGSDD